MAERRNGIQSYDRRKRGSDQRGVVAVPRGPRSLDYLKQSHEDKARLLEIARRHREQSVAAEGYGNRNLPAFKHKQEIIDLIENFKAVVLGGPTGSGKSTQVPQFLLEAGYDKIYMMVPRRIIADGLHERLVEELAEHLGKDGAATTVGVVHGERAEFSDESRIVVMTPNTFVRMEQSIRDQYADKKVAIISDEIHEANLYTEIATGVAAKSVDELESWRLIAASATHNVGSLQASFSRINKGYVPEVNIEGRPFTVDIQQAPHESPMEVYARLGENHEKSMIFTSGKAQIEHIIKETRKKLFADDLNGRVIFRILHGELNDIELLHINDPIPEEARLVIVASPAGMSGITIPGISLVITDGTINRQELDDENILGLQRDYLSRSEILQELGRAGRDIEGAVGVLAAPIVIEEDKIRARGHDVEIEQMPFLSLESKQRREWGPPEIYHSNLAQVALSIANLERRFDELNQYIQNPVEDTQIIAAEESLARIGALDDHDTITTIGRKMSKFPIRPELSRGIVEAVHNGRSLQHMARIAIITAGIEAGGVQEFRNLAAEPWQDLLRPTTRDDMIAQLDILMSDIPGVEHDRSIYIDYLEDKGLNYKRTERARKVSKKILKELGIRLENIVLVPPSHMEENDLRSDLTAGMIDLVYVRAKHDKQPVYRNIHGSEQSTPRRIGNRSVAPKGQYEYVAGFPRWFLKSTRKGQVKHDVVELLMPADPAIVAEYARNNQLLRRVRVQPRMNKGEVVEMSQAAFGTLVVGDPELHKNIEEIPKESQNVLRRYVLESPGPAQRALREVADELMLYERRVPSDRIAELMREDAPSPVTKKLIDDLVGDIVKTTRRAHEVDQALGEYIFHNNIGIHRYFDDHARKILQDSSPSGIVVNDTYLQIHYHRTQPYVTLSARLPQGYHITLPDGREVKVRHTKNGQSTYYRNVDLAIGEQEQ